MRFSFCACAVLVASAFSSVSPADAFANDLGEPIDLSSFSGMESALEESQQTLGADGMPVVQVYDDGGARWIRPYVTGIAGASFGTLNTGGGGGFGGTPVGFAGSVNEAMFTGGGAIGVAFDQPSGLLRMEVEGRARGPMQGNTQFFVVEETNGLPIDTEQLSDRVTFDTGYRFFAMSPASNPVSLNSGSFSQSIGSATSAFSASELLLSIRIYEPFRNWR